MRLTKLSELSSWKVRRLAQLSSSEWVWIVQHVLSVCYRRMERLTIVSGTNVELHMRRTKLKYRFSRGLRRSSRKWKKYCDKEIQLKLSLRSVKNSKLVSGKKPRNLSPRYGHVILISGYFVFTAVNWSQHRCAISGICMIINVNLASFGRKFITDLIRLISLTRLKFDVWPNTRF